MSSIRALKCLPRSDETLRVHDGGAGHDLPKRAALGRCGKREDGRVLACVGESRGFEQARRCWVASNAQRAVSSIQPKVKPHTGRMPLDGQVRRHSRQHH